LRDPFFRYFLASRPDARARQALAAIAEKVGQQPRPELLHLTFCVIAEVSVRDPLFAARVGAILADHSLSSVPIRLGKVRAGELGPMVRTIGRQMDIKQFYRTLTEPLASCGIFPRHRKSGLRPHVTLGYAPVQFDPFNVVIEWLPRELLLIESEVGNGRHHVVGRWPLLPPIQGSLCFEASDSRRLLANC
jgi:2'-5' RNA ligase